MSCPSEYIDLISKGGEHVSSLISPEFLVKTNPLKAWVDECLTCDESGLIPIGGKGSNKDPLTLYGSYLK